MKVRSWSVADPVARLSIVSAAEKAGHVVTSSVPLARPDGGRVDGRVGVVIEITQPLFAGNPAARTRPTVRRRSRSSHSASSSSARNPR
jgi:hypothetical protein